MCVEKATCPFLERERKKVRINLELDVWSGIVDVNNLKSSASSFTSSEPTAKAVLV